MELRIIRTDIVILAKSLNLSMINNKWIHEKKLIDENPIDFFNRPGMVNFISESYLITGSDQKIIFATNKDNLNCIESIQDVALNYLKDNKYVEYAALGLNFTAIIQNEHDLPEFNILVNGNLKIDELLNAKSIDSGAIIHAELEDCVLNLNIDKKDQVLEQKFNYHHDLTGLDHSEILLIVESLRQKLDMVREFSNAIIKKVD